MKNSIMIVNYVDLWIITIKEACCMSPLITNKANNPTSILASFSAMKSMVDAKQYRSPYQILAEFIQYIIIKQKLHSFTAIEMKNRLFEVFGFDLPEAVVRTATKGLQYIKIDNNIFHVNRSELAGVSFFEEKKTAAEAKNASVIDLLITFVKEAEPSSIIFLDTLTQEFIAYLLDDQQTTASGRYTDLIGQFILKYEANAEVQSSLTAIREGSILYIGLNYNINEIGSLKKPLTLFLGTEVLFSLYGFNGEIHKQLTQDLFSQIKAANAGERKITLRYFSETKREIDDFFSNAEYIAEGRRVLFDTVAMRAIVNGCSTAGDVRVKKADFFHTLQHGYGIIEDERTSYYEDADKPYNLESISDDPQMRDSIQLISHINKLRKGKTYPNILDAEYLLVTNTGNTLRASREQVERVKHTLFIENACDYAVSVEWLTNLLWYKLGNGLGGKGYPTNVNSVLKARTLLASKISQSVTNLYSETQAQYNAGLITADQLASRIITLRKKPIIPEELTKETIEESLDFSVEYITRYEEEACRNREALKEKEDLIRSIQDQSQRMLAEKDSVLAEKDQQLKDQRDKTSELEAELAQYHKKDKEKEKKKKKRKSIVCLIGSILLKIVAIAALFFLTKYLCDRLNAAQSNTIGLAVGLIGAITSVRSFFKKDLAKYNKSIGNE